MAQLKMTLAGIRDLVGGGEIHGDGEFICRSVAVLDDAGPDELSFVKDERYFDTARGSSAGALVVPEVIEDFSGHQLVVENPHFTFGQILAWIARERRRQPAGVHPTAVVDERACIGEKVTIGAGVVVREDAQIGDRSVLYPNVYVGQGSRLGEDVVLYPNVVIMEDIHLGDRVVIHGGTVVGAEGYGYVQHEGRHIKVPQIGEIFVGDDVEIGALATIDRATIGRTTIGRGTKIGDLVHIAHNCTVGEDVLLLPSVALSGSVTIGDHAVLAGRAGTSDNITIGEGAMLGGTSVAFKDVPPGATMWGNPARDKALQMRIEAVLSRLPEMQRELRALKKKLD
jgi:UDP-3-O-[3-hydroxymyristoyl] glucosamine N-acyltransferase